MSTDSYMRIERVQKRFNSPHFLCFAATCPKSLGERTHALAVTMNATHVTRCESSLNAFGDPLFSSSRSLLCKESEVDDEHYEVCGSLYSSTQSIEKVHAGGQIRISTQFGIVVSCSRASMAHRRLGLGVGRAMWRPELELVGLGDVA
jgi:hypothetical protein